MPDELSKGCDVKQKGSGDGDDSGSIKVKWIKITHDGVASRVYFFGYPDMSTIGQGGYFASDHANAMTWLGRLVASLNSTSSSPVLANYVANSNRRYHYYNDTFTGHPPTVPVDFEPIRSTHYETTGVT